MNGDELIKKLQNLKPELRKLQFYVVASNGMIMPPCIKFQKKDLGKLDLTKENIEYAVLTDE